MSDSIAFRPRVKATKPIEAPPAGEFSGGSTAKPPEAFNLTITLGPFVVGEPAPVWADVAAMVVAEARREWEQQHAAPGTTQTPD